MACEQAVRSAQESQILPNQVSTEQQSLIVVKKLLAIAVSGITYLRGLFPKKAYRSRHVDDEKVMILRGDPSCPGAAEIIHWMRGCFDAIENKYLRTVIMSIYTDPENPQRVTEFYQFSIEYTANGAQMDFESNNNKMAVSCGNIKKASILMVRKLYTLMQNLGPLPNNVCITMKLAYYDDVTPQDYQPTGFKESDDNTLEFEKEPVKLTMGEVATSFHTLRLDMATERHRLEEVEERVHLKERSAIPMQQSHVRKDDEKLNEDNTTTEMSCHEKTESSKFVMGMDTLVKRTSVMEVDLRRTRSGRIIGSTQETNTTVNKKKPAMKEKLVSQYVIHNSQETPSTSVPSKRYKFSEPKELL